MSFRLQSLNILYLFMLAILLAACQAQTPTAQAPNLTPVMDQTPQVITEQPGVPATVTASPTTRPTLRPSSTLAPTATRVPSFTPVPTATATLPPTPFPPLAASRPYLVYYSEPGGKPSIILLNADASGRQVIPLPEGSGPPALPGALSPNGEWMVFYTGSAGELVNGEISGDAFDLTLNLMHLPDGKIRTVTPLLSKDYPANLAAIAKQFVTRQKISGFDFDEKQVLETISGLFIQGLTQAEWSPNGQTLAFAGAMQGPSSDIYLYNLASGKIKQMTDGDEQVLWMTWSPDGNYILQGSSNQVGEGDFDSRYVIEVGSGKIWSPTNMVSHGGVVVLRDWAGPHTLTFFSAANGLGRGFLNNIDIVTNQVTGLYSNAFQDFEIDAENNLIALLLSNDYVNHKDITPGLYLYHSDSGKLDFVTSIPDDQFYSFNVLNWGQPLYPFLVWDKEKVYGLSSDGKLTAIANNPLQAVSMNRRLVVVSDAKAKPHALKFIDERGEVAYQAPSISENFSDWMFSNPDSSGFFTVYARDLYYLDLETGVWKQVDFNVPELSQYARSPLLFGWKK